MPNKKKFDPVKENISIEVCHRDSCRSSGFNTSLRDTQGVLLMDKLTNVVPLTQQFCRSAVTISCHPKGELKPIDTQITLFPVQTYQCSSEDIIIPSYLTSEPVKLCSSKDLKISRALARDEDYAAHFTDAVCQTPTSGLRLNSAVAWFLQRTSELEIYPLTCTLRNCTWNVTVIKGKECKSCLSLPPLVICNLESALINSNAFDLSNIDVLPKKEVYNPAEDELSPRICVWNACRSSNLSLVLVDKNDKVIEKQVDNKLAPMSLVCRSLVILVRRPIRGNAATLLTHNIALSPMITYACANRDFFISPKALIAAKKRIRICLPTGSAENKVSESEGHVHPADNETLYKTQFKDVICNSTKTGIRFAQGFAIFEEVDDSREEYPVECRLYECIWGFLIVKHKKGMNKKQNNFRKVFHFNC
ncbi:unnamed protein product [Dibothriocephalus latus]|uniref:Uncharacterized protein n=1 Tax=Dibothriocephalus latus TaxID=60516 RepID=A0A3P7N9A6_DIBLA|nr:unnamed protein product [Dibothriocephalus latus]